MPSGKTADVPAGMAKQSVEKVRTGFYLVVFSEIDCLRKYNCEQNMDACFIHRVAGILLY